MMTDDLISRKKMEEDFEECNDRSHKWTPERVKCLIYRQPNVDAADVATVRHGQWEPGNPICPVCGENKFKDLDADIWCDWMPGYCPNCGAKMDGGND